ncbi:MAG: TlyA family RNA methyltransferase [Spirochaetota bacterium]
MKRTRLLDRLCALHPDRSREELLSLVLCGDVRVDRARIRDPQERVRADAAVSIERDRYVGRGGLKLEYALAAWHLPVRGRVFLDAGASTGGFTDCLLQHGARAVHAVDVGHNQLDYRLRTDDRVIVHERTNIMHVEVLEPPPHAAVADLSFRSLRGAARSVVDLTTERYAVLLVKPQFEWSDPPAGFSGTVPAEAIGMILSQTLTDLVDERLALYALEESPITGRSGNREFLLLAGEPGSIAARDSRPVAELVAAALAEEPTRGRRPEPRRPGDDVTS